MRARTVYAVALAKVIYHLAVATKLLTHAVLLTDASKKILNLRQFSAHRKHLLNNMAATGSNRLPGVEETILKRRKRNDVLQARHAKASLRNQKPKKPGTKIVFRRAEKLIKEFRLRQRDNTRLNRQARWHRADTDSNIESKLAFAVRIHKTPGMNARSVRALKLLRLEHMHNGTFLKLNTTTLNLLRVVEPYVTWGYPNLKIVRDLLYKHGFGSVDEKRTPLTSNADIEKMLGQYDIICLEDLVHEIVTVGPHFKEVNSFLLRFKLNTPSGGWKKKLTQSFADGGECGARGDKMNDLLKYMI